MPIATISKEGLAVTAILVALLWACIGLERLSVRQADQAFRRTVHEMQLLRTRCGRPAAAPGQPETISAGPSLYRVGA
jgi:hypothetical protein